MLKRTTVLWYYKVELWLANSTKRKIKESSERENDIFMERTHCSYHMERQKTSAYDINYSQCLYQIHWKAKGELCR